VTELKIDYPGLIEEKLPSGSIRYRVRIEGNPKRRIRLHVDPEHKDFREHYLAARAGIQMKPDVAPIDRAIKGSFGWLIHRHLNKLEKQVEAGRASPLTLKKRKGLFARLLPRYGEYTLHIPTHQIVKIRDELQDKPSIADAMVKAIRVMYREAIADGILTTNPATGIGNIDLGRGGAKPWTVDDLRTFRERHPPGTNAHLCLTLFMFTACRISDAVLLGRHNEFERAGVRAIGWQPTKKGSKYVEIPMLPSLYKATRRSNVVGATYLLTDYGKPYKTADALGQRFRKWCDQAGLTDLSSHGIRKAAGHLLALEGCSQYQIMAIHGHAQAKTSEIYTKGVERWQLAREAMETLQGLEW